MIFYSVEVGALSHVRSAHPFPVNDKVQVDLNSTQLAYVVKVVGAFAQVINLQEFAVVSQKQVFRYWQPSGVSPSEH